jgi:hypothetical protein
VAAVVLLLSLTYATRLAPHCGYKFLLRAGGRNCLQRLCKLLAGMVIHKQAVEHQGATILHVPLRHRLCTQLQPLPYICRL